MTPPPLPPLPPRDTKGHKGTFGTVVVAGGCAGGERRMIGAPALAARAALRAGAGLAKLLMPASIVDAAIGMCPSATGLPIPEEPGGGIMPHMASQRLDEALEACQCLVVGPGLGESNGARTLALRAVQQDQAPVVVDADAINALAAVPELSRDFRAAAILTPHPGEFRRLAAALGMKDDPVKDESRPAAAAALAQRLGCIVVLKGPGTVVSDGQRTWECPHGGAELATAGTGDVLSGIIAGIVSQFVAYPWTPGVRGGKNAGAGDGRPASRPLDLFDAARLGVAVHGKAGEQWAKRHGADAGLLAMELADEVPGVMGAMRRP